METGISSSLTGHLAQMQFFFLHCIIGQLDGLYSTVHIPLAMKLSVFLSIEQELATQN